MHQSQLPYFDKMKGSSQDAFDQKTGSVRIGVWSYVLISGFPSIVFSLYKKYKEHGKK